MELSYTCTGCARHLELSLGFGLDIVFYRRLQASFGIEETKNVNALHMMRRNDHRTERWSSVPE